MSEEEFKIDDAEERNWLWIAADSKGELAIFETMRFGAYPRSLCKSIGDAEVLDEFVDDLVIKGQPSCIGHFKHAYDLGGYRSTLGPKESRDLDAHVEGVKRTAALGFYVYVPCSTGSRKGDYVLAGYPSVPRPLSSLPVEIRRIVQAYRLSDVQFEQSCTLEREMWETM